MRDNNATAQQSIKDINSTDQKLKLEAAIDDLARDPDIKKIVADIEGRIKTTKGHYGDYMSFLTNFKDRTSLYIMSQALLKAGADQEGISGALMILKP
jgi:hypothetical protein